MNNLKIVLKKNKVKVIVICAVLVAFALIIIATLLMFTMRGSVYGDRCDEVKNKPITSSDENAIKEVIKNYENIELKDIHIDCRLINITVNLTQDTDFNVVDEMSKGIINSVDSEKLNLYDIELIVTSSNKEDNTYPKIGTRHKLINDSINDHFVW